MEELGRGTLPNVCATFWGGFMNISLVCLLKKRAGERAKLCNTKMLLVSASLDCAEMTTRPKMKNQPANSS